MKKTAMAFAGSSRHLSWSDRGDSERQQGRNKEEEGEEEDDDEVEGFDDFTLASPWERFIKDVEETCRQWQAAGPAVLQLRGSEQVEDLPVLHAVRHEQPHGMNSYSITYYFPVARASVAGASVKQPAGIATTSDHSNQRKLDGSQAVQRPPPDGTNVSRMIEDNVDEWGTDLHYLQLWFGVREFLVVAPMNPNECATDLHEAMMLLSSMAIALSNCDCSWPVFIPVRDPLKLAFLGIQGSESCISRRFEVDCSKFRRVSASLMHLGGLYDLFMSKVSGGINPAISLSMRATYRLRLMGCSGDGESLLSMDDEFAYSAGWEQDGQWDFDCPWAYWHPMDDPIKGLELTVIWRNLQANSPSDLGAMEKLPAQSADDWILRVVLYKDTLDAELDEEPLGFARQLRSMAVLMYQAEGVQFMEDFVSGSTTDLRGLLGVAASLAVPPPSVVGRVIRDLFDEGSFSNVAGSSSMYPYHLVAKTAPPESLFSRFCLHALRFSNIRAIVVLWLDFVRELRFYWEEGVELPRLPSTGPPDLGCCLVHQKLQMLSLCIRRKIAEEEQQSSRTERVNAGADQQSGATSHQQCQGSHAQGLEDGVHKEVMARLAESQAGAGKRLADDWNNDRRNEDFTAGRASNKGRSSDNGGRMGDRGGMEPKTKEVGGGAGIDDEGWEVDFNVRLCSYLWLNDSVQTRDLAELIELEERNGSGSAVSERKDDSDSTGTKYESCSDAESQFEEGSGVVDTSASLSALEFKDQGNSRTASCAPSTRNSPWGLQTGSSGGAREGVCGIGKVEAKRRGALRPAGDLKLLKYPVQMYVPTTQEPLHMTEDMLMEREQALAALGDSEMGRDARARLECDVLASDMSAFKAANPGAVLEDFVRWHSPHDWIEDDGHCDHHQQTDDAAGPSGRRQMMPKTTGKVSVARGIREDVKRKKSSKASERGQGKEAAEVRANSSSRSTTGKLQPRQGVNAHLQHPAASSSGQVKGRLSQRMQDENNIWHQLWRKAEPVPACDQKPLFDYRREAEKVMHYLDTVEPYDLLVQMVCTSFTAAAYVLQQSESAEMPSLVQGRLELDKMMAAVLDPSGKTWKQEGGEAATVAQKQLTELCAVFEHVEDGIVTGVSLARKFKKVPRVFHGLMQRYCEGPGSICVNIRGGAVAGGSTSSSKGSGKAGAKGGGTAGETEREVITQLFTLGRKIKRKKWGNEWCANLLEGLPPSAREITMWGGALHGGVLEGGDLEGVAPGVGREAMESGLGDGLGVCDRMYVRLTPKDLRIALALVSRE